MKCLSLWQPWASYLVTGEKKIETRHWPTKYRGKLLIHAAKTTESCSGGQIATMPFGAIIGIVDLVDCIRTEELRDKINPHEAQFGNYGDDRFGWVTENQFRFEKPIPYRGQQGLFEVSAQIAPGGVIAGGGLLIYVENEPFLPVLISAGKSGVDLSALEERYGFKLSDYFKPGEMIYRDAIAMIVQRWEPEVIHKYIRERQQKSAAWIGGAK